MDFLPNEILIEIFTHVEYWDLKIRLPLVCRRFRDVLKGDGNTPTRTVLDKCLFRDAPVPSGRGPDASGRNVHPVFDILYYRYTVSIFDIDVHYDDRVGPVPRKRAVKLPIGSNRMLWGREWLSSSKIGRENAVSPAVKDAMLQVSETRVRPVKGTGRKGAITVIDVMENMMRKKYGTHWHPTIALQDTWKGIGHVITDADGMVHLYPQFASVTEEDREYTRLYKATYGFSRNLRREGVWGKIRSLRGNSLVRIPLFTLLTLVIIHFREPLSSAINALGGAGRIGYLVATPLAYVICRHPWQASQVSGFSLLAYFFSFFRYNWAFYSELTFVMLSMIALTSSGYRWTVILRPRVALPVFAIILHLISTFRRYYQAWLFGPGGSLKYVPWAFMTICLVLISVFCRTFFSALSSLTALWMFFAFTFF